MTALEIHKALIKNAMKALEGGETLQEGVAGRGKTRKGEPDLTMFFSPRTLKNN